MSGSTEKFVNVHEGKGPSQRWTKPMAPQKTMGAKLSNQDLTNAAKAPGPGAYKVTGGIGQLSGTKSSVPKSSFGKEKRMGVSTSGSLSNPGPGHYRSSSGLGKQASSAKPSSAASSLSGRTRLANKPADMMGPGVCREDSFLRPSTSPNQKWASSYSFGAKLPAKSADRNNPGPGAYEHAQSSMARQIASTSGSAPSYSLSSRPDDARKGDTCFPCREDSFTEGSKYAPERGFSFGGRHMNGELAIQLPPKGVPGPGMYGEIGYVTSHSTSALDSPPVWSFGHENRPDPAGPGATRGRSAGPGSYELPRSCVKQPDSLRPSSPQHSFGFSPATLAMNAARETAKAGSSQAAAGASPGGGAASVAGPQLSTPGPGTYTLRTTLGAERSSPAVHRAPAIGLAGREKFGSAYYVDTAGAGPGPAAFALPSKGPSEHVTQSASAKYRFGTSKREDVAAGVTRYNPGPGAYAHERFHTVKTKAPQFSMGSRIVAKSNSSETQGPGRCREDAALGRQKSSTQWSSPQFSFGSRFKNRRADDSPGPGAYG